MTEELWIDGLPVIYRKGVNGYVAVFGEDYAVHFKCPTGSTWVARRPRALESICSASSLIDCVRLAKRHYDTLTQERAARVTARLADLAVTRQHA
jgi:hypothetical protein